MLFGAIYEEPADDQSVYNALGPAPPLLFSTTGTVLLDSTYSPTCTDGLCAQAVQYLNARFGCSTHVASLCTCLSRLPLPHHSCFLPLDGTTLLSHTHTHTHTHTHRPHTCATFAPRLYHSSQFTLCSIPLIRATGVCRTTSCRMSPRTSSPFRSPRPRASTKST